MLVAVVVILVVVVLVVGVVVVLVLVVVVIKSIATVIIMDFSQVHLMHTIVLIIDKVSAYRCTRFVQSAGWGEGWGKDQARAQQYYIANSYWALARLLESPRDLSLSDKGPYFLPTVAVTYGRRIMVNPIMENALKKCALGPSKCKRKCKSPIFHSTTLKAA